MFICIKNNLEAKTEMDNRVRRPRPSMLCPSGMEYLAKMDEIFVEQNVHLLKGELDI